MNVKIGFEQKRKFYFTKSINSKLSEEITARGCKMEACKWHSEQVRTRFYDCYNGVFYILQETTLSDFKKNFKLLTNSNLLDKIPETNNSQGIFLPIDIFGDSPAILDILAIIIRLLDLPRLFESREELIKVIGPRIIYKNGNANRYYTKGVAKAIENFDKFILKAKKDKSLDDLYQASVYGPFGLIDFLKTSTGVVFLNEIN